MDNDNLKVSHMAWCRLIALHAARRDGLVTSPAQNNLFLTRWLATTEKQRRCPRALANDIRWLQRSGWRREAAGGSEKHLHHLLADGFSAA